jgi:hypothetical protein
MPVIRISAQTLERLKRWAEPLTDTAESALVKVLDAADHEPSPAANLGALDPDRRATRPSNGKRLSLEELRQPLMETIYEMGGSVRAGALRPVMRERLSFRLASDDLEPLSSGEERWWNATRWERHQLVEEGLLRSDSERGTWELSEKGASLVETWFEKMPASFIDHLLALPDVGDDADFEQPRSGPRPVEL